MGNTGSTARDQLALERTFLAWTRTGLGFIALGIAIERFNALEPLINPHRKERRNYGPAFTVIGTGSMMYGTVRYISTAKALTRGVYVPGYLGVAVFITSVTTIAASQLLE